jgi:hypothetical protein
MLLALAALSCGARADDVILVDGSGSMYQRLEGQQKIDLLKKKVLPFWERSFLKEKDARLSLVRFGHKSASCASSEVFLDLGRDAFLKRLREMSPKPYAETALVPSLRLIRDQFAKRKLETLLVVSDGENSCEGDPCALMDELRAGHPGLRIKMLYFGTLRKDAEKKVLCEKLDVAAIANAEQLETALETYEKERLVARDEKSKPAETPTPATRGFLKILNIPEDEVFEAKLLKSADPKKRAQARDVTIQGTGSELVSLEAGAHLVELKAWNAVARARVEAGRTSYLDYFESFRLPAAVVTVKFGSKPLGIEYTLKSGRGRGFKIDERVETRPGVNVLQLSAPAHLKGLRIEGLLLRPKENFVLDLAPYLGIYQNEAVVPSFVRNKKYFEKYGALAEGTAILLQSKQPVALVPGEYVVETSGESQQLLDVAPLADPSPPAR